MQGKDSNNETYLRTFGENKLNIPANFENESPNLMAPNGLRETANNHYSVEDTEVKNL